MNISKLFNWLKESNRPKHIKAGAVIFIPMLIFQQVSTFVSEHISDSVLNDTFYRLSFMSDCATSLVTTMVAMMSVEYIQKSLGFKWDWLDILAGCLVGVGMTVLSAIGLSLL